MSGNLEAAFEALGALDTPTVCNALEVVVPSYRGQGFTVDPLVCAFPDLAPMVGFARTGTIRAMHAPAESPAEVRQKRFAYYDYVADGPRPGIVVLQDIDAPRNGYGAFWGEVMTNVHKGLGCLGTITDGSVRDLDAVADGFQLLAGRIGPSHAHIHLVDFGCEVTVAGMRVRSGDLVHADRHGAVTVPLDAIDELLAVSARQQRREAHILAAAADPAFDAARLRQAIAEADDIQ